jgi:hypothetical protein
MSTVRSSPETPSGRAVKFRGEAMKPSLSLLDHSFQYVPAAATSVAETWRRFGWRPPSDLARATRVRPTYAVRRVHAASMRNVEVIHVAADGSADAVV